MVFLDYFLPSNKTNAPKTVILECKQDYDESMSQYWSRFKGLLDACPNHRMVDTEIFYLFYEGANPESNDLMNTLSARNFTKKKVSEAREILGRLIDAKKAYDQPRAILKRSSTNLVMEQGDERVEARIDRLEKALLVRLRRRNPCLKRKGEAPMPRGKPTSILYGPSWDGEYQAQVNAIRSWNPDGSWNLGRQKDATWRDHPNFRWSDNNPPPQQQNTNPPEGQSNWSNRNQGGQGNQSN